MLELQLNTVEESFFFKKREGMRAVVLPGQAGPPSPQAGYPARKRVRFYCRVYFYYLLLLLFFVLILFFCGLFLFIFILFDFF